MPPITAIVHTANDALRIGRALESLRVCDQVIVVDHDSRDQTTAVARSYGAAIRCGDAAAAVAAARHDWILCLLPTEALHENLEAALHEWKDTDPGDAAGFRIAVREESGAGWQEAGTSLRLVHRARIALRDPLPVDGSPEAPTIPGHILRFARP